MGGDSVISDVDQGLETADERTRTEIRTGTGRLCITGIQHDPGSRSSGTYRAPAPLETRDRAVAIGTSRADASAIASTGNNVVGVAVADDAPGSR